MQICIVRHAIAEDRDTWRGSDDDRPLTARGREKMVGAAKGLAKLVDSPVIYTSPRRRATESADILCEVFGVDAAERTDTLAWGADDRLFALIAEVEGVAMVVGHEPLLSRSLSYCLTGDHAAISSVFKKGAAALVTFYGPPAPGRGTLEWLLQPAALRTIGG